MSLDQSDKTGSASVSPERAQRDDPAVDDVSRNWGRPACPRCGWSNTRPAMSRTLGDHLLRVFALRPFRCRSCGKRFRALRQRPVGD